MTKPEERRTASGRTLTDAEVEALAAEVEQADYDVEALKARRRGRPPMGSGPADVVPVRMDPELRAAIEARATADQTTASDIIRQAIREVPRRGVESPSWPKRPMTAPGGMPWVYRDLWRAERAERLGRTLGVPEHTIRRPVALIGKGSGGFRHRAGRQGGPPVCRRGLSRPPSSSSDRATGGNPRTAGSMA